MSTFHTYSSYLHSASTFHVCIACMHSKFTIHVNMLYSSESLIRSILILLLFALKAYRILILQALAHISIVGLR